MSQMPEAGLELEARFFFLAFILYFFKPRIEVDGGPPVQIQWGVNRIPLSAGQHRVLVYFPYLFIKKCGPGELAFAVSPGQVAQARYKPPFFVFMPGKLAQTGVRPMVDGSAPMAAPVAPGASVAPTMPAAQPAPVANWYPDPTGRHQHRYWDGQQWTASVADSGVTGTDSL